MNTQFILTPLDTFFFRDGKPFSRGEQTEATTIFPPFPSTVYGALRATYISEKGWEAFKGDQLEKVIGTKDSDEKSSFRVKGVFLEDREGNTYFPLPRDLAADKRDLKAVGAHEKSIPAYPLSLVSNRVTSNAPLQAILMNQRNLNISVEYPSQGAFITSNNIKQYLLGAKQGLELHTLKRFLDDEPKIGIARNSQTLTTEEGHLYRVNMLRFKEDYQWREGLRQIQSYHLRVDVRGIDLTQRKGILKLGGEAKAFAYRFGDYPSLFEYSEEEKTKILQKIEKERKFKLYFATPVIWETPVIDKVSGAAKIAGWKAEWMDGKHKFIGENGTAITCKLLTAAIGNYLNVGGWDMYYGCPKTMYRAVPAGSVYYFELLPGQKPEDVLKVFHYHNISTYRAKEGFGLILVGVAEEENS